MGGRLAGLAASRVLPHLGNHATRTVLLVMACTALDTDTDPAYFGGSDTLAWQLGYGHVCGDPSTCTRRISGEPRMACDPAGERAVGRALRALIDLGVIEQLEKNRTHNRRWLLRERAWLTLLSGRDTALASHPVENVSNPPEPVDKRPEFGHLDTTLVSGQTGHQCRDRGDTGVRSETTPVSGPEERLEEPPQEQSHEPIPSVADLRTGSARQPVQNERRGAGRGVGPRRWRASRSSETLRGRPA